MGMNRKLLKFITLSLVLFALAASMLLLEAGFYLPAPGLLVWLVAGGQLVAALPLCADVPATAAALSGHADDRRGNASGRRFYVGVIRMSLDILLARGVIDRRALNILLSSRDGQARLQQWVERAQEDDTETENAADSVPRDTGTRASGYEKRAPEHGVSRFGVIKLIMILVIAVAFLKSCTS